MKKFVMFAAIAAGSPTGFRIEAQSAFLFFRAVARNAVLHEQRPHFLFEVIVRVGERCHQTDKAQTQGEAHRISHVT